jgi:peptidyl-prolyl cis-trans isomerase D
MFDVIRKHQRLLQFVLLLLILPAFVFFGLSGYQGMMSPDAGVGSVAGRPITQQDFDEAQRERLAQMRQMLGDAVDPAMLDTPAARTELLEGLISQRAMAAQAAARQVAVSDDRLRQTVLSIPGLTRPDGSFDDARYKALLSAQNLTPAAFEARLRSELSMQMLPEAVQSSAIMPRALRDRLAALQDESREVRVLAFPALDYRAKVNPDEAALKAYYDANPTAFEIPESAKIEYVVLSREALAAQVTVGADDLKAYYEQNKARFGSPEERRASHILIKAGPDARAKAEQLMAKLKADPSQFKSLARTASDDPGSAAQEGDLGFFSRGLMVKPFADAVFGMQKGELKGPVESEFGQHIILLTDVKPGAEKPFEAVRAEIERDVRLQQAGQKYAEAAENFTNTVYEQSDSLKPVADKYGLTIRTAEGITRQPAPNAPRGSALASARLLGAVFGTDVARNKRNTEAIEIATGQLASARVVDFQPARRKPLADVMPQVKEAVMAQEAAKLARQAGEARLAELKAGKGDLTGFAAARRVNRSDPGGLDPAAIQAIFKMSAQPLPGVTGVELGNQGYLIAQLLTVEAPGAETVAKRAPAIDEQGTRLLAQQDVASFMEAVKARTDIVRHPERLVRKTDAP